MRRAQGDGNCGSSFSTSCQDWRDVGHRCRASTTGSVGQVLHRKALHSSPSLLLFSPRGHNDRNHRGFGHLCWLGAGDGMLHALAWGGAVLSLVLIAGVAQAPVLLLLWICYLSLSVAGQTFLWFQWDGLLLETGLLAVLYAPIQLRPSLLREPAPSTAMRWLVWALVFRLMFVSGIPKLVSGD